MTSELLEIIEWNDDSRDTLTYRYPDHDRAIKRGARLVVRESQAAQFVYLGEFADTYGPGTHTLVTGTRSCTVETRMSRVWSGSSDRRIAEHAFNSCRSTASGGMHLSSVVAFSCGAIRLIARRAGYA